MRAMTYSTSLEPLTAFRKRDTFWAPTGPGIESFPIPGATEPAATPALRLTQMRSIARELSASTVRGKVERIRYDRQRRRSKKSGDGIIQNVPIGS
jgi:hypothetical protein